MSEAEYRDNPGKCDFCKEEVNVLDGLESQARETFILESGRPDSNPRMVWACTEHIELLDNVLQRAKKEVQTE